MSVSLKARWNYVVYTGKAQPSLDALASIAPYLASGYYVGYWNNADYRWEVMQKTPGIPYDRDIMVPYGIYSIKVLQDCLWAYGPDATPPESVRLYAGRFNGVAYSGPVQRSLDALAEIAPYLEPGKYVGYWNNETYNWELTETPGIPVYDRNMMVPNGYYSVWVTQDCTWSFVIAITAPDSAQKGATVSVIVKVTNIQPYGYRFRTQIYKVPDKYPSELIGSVTEAILSGASKTYTASFAMPDCNTTILVWVETELGVTWQYYNSASRVVSLEALSEFSNLAISSFSKA